MPLYTDARHYSAAGIPTVVYGAGPHTLLEANGHRADEKLKLDDLYRATEVVAQCLHDLLGALVPPIELKGGPLTIGEIEAWIAEGRD